MEKCSLVGCTEKVIGGFQELISTGNFQNPNAVIPGQRTFWCEIHEESLKEHIASKPGRFIQFPQEQP